MNLEALFNAVIVKPIEQNEEMYGSIVVPDIGKDRNEHGTVMAVGPGRQVAGVGFIETEIKVGDTVILPTIGFTKLEHKGEEYYIGQENQILARIKKEVNVEGILAETEVSEEEKEEFTKTIENE